jgi:hypothetical protein
MPHMINKDEIEVAEKLVLEVMSSNADGLDMNGS